MFKRHVCLIVTEFKNWIYQNVCLPFFLIFSILVWYYFSTNCVMLWKTKFIWHDHLLYIFLNCAEFAFTFFFVVSNAGLDVQHCVWSNKRLAVRWPIGHVPSHQELYIFWKDGTAVNAGTSSSAWHGFGKFSFRRLIFAIGLLRQVLQVLIGIM